MPARRRPLDPLSPLERERDPAALRKIPTREAFIYAFSSNSPHVRNRERRKAQGIQPDAANGAAGAADA